MIKVRKSCILLLSILLILFIPLVSISKALEQDTINSVYGRPPIVDLNMPTGWERRSVPQYNNEGYARGMFEYNSTHIFVDYYSKKKISENLNKGSSKPSLISSYYILSEYGHNSSELEGSRITIGQRDVRTAQYIYIPSSKQICTNDKVVEVGKDWFEIRYNSYYYYFQATSVKNVTIDPTIVSESISNYTSKYLTPISSNYATCFNKEISTLQLQSLDRFDAQGKIDYLVNNDQFGDAIIQFKVCTSISNRDFNANVDSDALSQVRNLVSSLKPGEGDLNNTLGIEDSIDPCLKFFTTNSLPRTQEEINECHDIQPTDDITTTLNTSQLREMVKSQYDSKTFESLDGSGTKINLHHKVIDNLSDQALMCLFDQPDESRLKQLKENDNNHDKWKKERDGGFWGINNVGYAFADGWHSVANYDYAGSADNLLGFVPIVGDVYDGYRAASGNSIAGSVSCSDRVITGAFTVISGFIVVTTGGAGSIASRIARGAIREIVENTGEKLVKTLIKGSLKELIESTIKKTLKNAVTGYIVGNGIQLLLAGVLSPDKPKNAKPMSIEEQVKDKPILDQNGDYNQTKLAPYYDQITMVDTNIDNLEAVAYRVNQEPDNQSLQSQLVDLLFVKVYAGSALYKKVKSGVEIVTRNVSKLSSLTTYVHGPNKNYFNVTNKKGWIVHAFTDDLKLDKTKRVDLPSNNTPGKLLGDHAGHLIADVFGGSELKANLVSMLSSINLSKYKKIENQWVKEINAGKKVSVDIKCSKHSVDGRPGEIIVEYKIDGVKFNPEPFLN
jgi:Cu/Ag efflux protein CusF